MPTIQTAKVITENALSTIGAFPASRSAPDPGEMKRGLRWLEMLLNYETAIRPIGFFWQVIEIPLEAGVGDYDLSDYADERGVCHVFSAFLVDQSGEADPINFEYRSALAAQNFTRTGKPQRVVISHDDIKGDGVISVFPTPTQVEQDAGLVLRLRVQTFHESIDNKGNADNDVRLRPSWYLWATKRLAYEIGNGPVRRLAQNELILLANDATAMETALLARDTQMNSPSPPCTDSNDLAPEPGGYARHGYRRV